MPTSEPPGAVSEPMSRAHQHAPAADTGSGHCSAQDVLSWARFNARMGVACEASPREIFIGRHWRGNKVCNVVLAVKKSSRQ